MNDKSKVVIVKRNLEFLRMRDLGKKYSIFETAQNNRFLRLP